MDTGESKQRPRFNMEHACLPEGHQTMDGRTRKPKQYGNSGSSTATAKDPSLIRLS